MGLLQSLAKTYDFITSLDDEKKKEFGAKDLALLYHKPIAIDIQILLNKEGELLDITEFRKDNKPKGIMPVTEASGSRGSGIAPHPLVEDIKNLILEENAKAYLSQLKKWCDADLNNIVINAVYKYVSKGTLEDDLKAKGVVVSKIDKGEEKVSKAIIGWVVIDDEKNIKSWDSSLLVESYTKFVNENYKNFASTGDVGFCMISGQENAPIADKTMRITGQAKLISSNDSYNFTYRGRFIDSKDAMSIGSVASQKAINALIWLYNSDKYSIRCGENARLICWSPSGVITSLSDPLSDFEIITSDFPMYKAALEDYIKGKTSDKNTAITPVSVVILEAVTKGRLSVKFYRETTYKDYLEALKDWTLKCSWVRGKKIVAPSLFCIIKYAFGLKKKNDFEVDWKKGITSKSYSELLERRIVNGRMPESIVNALVGRCNKLNVYEDKAGLLYTTCAVLRKYHFGRNGKEYGMDINKDEKDCSYLYGRLLAVLEKLELDAKGDNGSKDTNAMRMLSVFVSRPRYVTAKLLERLKIAYYPRFTGSKCGLLINYEKLIGEILEKLKDAPNKALKDTWILGYYAQKAELWKKKEETGVDYGN